MNVKEKEEGGENGFLFFPQINFGFQIYSSKKGMFLELGKKFRCFGGVYFLLRLAFFKSCHLAAASVCPSLFAVSSKTEAICLI